MPHKLSKRSVAAPKAPSSTAPPPFVTAPTSLEPLLEVLDPRYIYLTHIDTHPRLYKRRIFLIPVVLNLIFAALIALRLNYAVPKYLSILSAMLGLGGADAVETKTASWRALAGLAVKRGLMLGGDWLLLKVVGSWPFTFFVEGPENACTWRWKCGFRDREVVVRQSRGWGGGDLMLGNKKGAESPFWRTKVLPAVEPEWVATKTGYLMMGKDWDLDFPAMVAAQRAVDSGSMGEDDVAGYVLAWTGKPDGEGEWVTWRFATEREVEELKPRPQQKDEYGQTEEEGAKQMLLVRDKLASLGKEGVFFRMIEVAQYEGSVPGRSQQERERITLEEVQKLFDSNGVDFAKLMEELKLDWPGLDKAS